MYTIEIYQIDVVNGVFIRKDSISTFNSLSFFNSLNGIGGANFTMNAQDPKTNSENLYRYRNLIAVKDNSTIVFFGPIIKISGNYEGVEGRIQVQCAGYLYYLMSRFTAQEDFWTNTDAAAIVTSMLTTTQAKTNGNLLISSGTIQATTTRDRSYYYKPIGEAIQDLSNVIGGFDFNFSASTDSSGRLSAVLFNAYVALGTIRTDLPSLKLGINVQKISFATQGDIVNQVIARGSGSGTGILTAPSENAASEQSFTRKEDVIKFDDISIQGTLQQKADEYLAANQSENYDINITLMPGKYPSYGDFVLGDTLLLDLRIPGTIINFPGYGRVIEIRVDVDNEGVGKVTPKIEYTR